MQDVESDTTIINLFKGFVNECKDQDMELILVCSPIHTDDGTKYFDMDAFWTIISSIVKDKDIPIMNYQDLYGSDTTYFIDPMHLNKYGRDCFTKILAHDLDSLGYLKR